MNTLLMVLGQVILFLLILLWNEYVGTLLTVILGAIAFFVWGISYVVEWIQPSRVTRTYYGFVLATWLGPLVALLLFVALRGELAWLTP